MKLIVLNYPIADFIYNAQVLSMYRASGTLSSGGEAIVMDTILNTSDEQILTRYLKAGAVIIADIMSGYTKNILDQDGVMLLDPYEFGGTLGLLTNQLIYRLNMPDTVIDSAIDALDEAIRDGLENYIIYRTAKHRSIENQSYLQDWNECLDNIRKYLNRRSEGTHRNYNIY